ncbi:molybdopterin molybdotransferase MoeA [Crenobacter sp. SG2303]|uniref:Molybdopterin molybdenumtransferase n=1 Tax=Crenobacter oryzisoli TaxID=3056844 RepID=A0ABT7XNL3_9NEIS|nr:gephyrin-like molybdotransferase Glp [Crenobacter sp. SG2303]MDN0075388.1 molybdopterin molybdotransferase MoeA [Crenobacter sp. SG2303]
MSNTFLSVDQARAWLLERARPLAGSESVELLAAAGRVLAEAVTATLNVPPHDNSAMDGYALRLADFGQALPVSQRVPAGSVPTPLQAGTVARIFTGAPIPLGADAVIMQEQAEVLEDGRVLLSGNPEMGQNIRLAGEDIADGQVVLKAGQRLGPADLGLAASLGIAKLAVRRALTVAAFFTGDELTEPGQPLSAGKIYNSNRYWLVTSLTALGCRVIDLGIIPDNLAATRVALAKAASEADVIITCGGVSVGEEDHVKAAVEAEGELTLWKIAMKPGKPLAYGRIGAADFIGLPGNPVSGFVTFEVLVKAFLAARQGGEAAKVVATERLPAAFHWDKPDTRREEFVRVRRELVDGHLQLVTYPNQGSGVLMSCAWAEGLVRLAPGQRVSPGELLDFLPLTRG